jgi:hypothetical protein
MDEGPILAGAASIAPDLQSAINALGLASGMLILAEDCFAKEDYPAAFEHSRNAIRMASSALLFRDGIMSDSLEATAAHLLKRYPGVFPIDGWEQLEAIPLADSPGLYNMLLSLMGKLKKTGEQEAREAILVAGSFIMSANSEMGL